MSTSIHPYKGYLNTQYRIFVKGEEPLRFQVYSVDKEDGQAVLDGVVEPNQPYNINMQSAGEYVIKFEDGSTHNFRVEDGYRYGGNKLKNAFIFDECPWAFVVMHDRTYFYNRLTQQSFVEPISPDDIEEIAADYVLFKSAEHNELTLFSLEQQEPILWMDNIAFHTNETICWTEQKGGEHENDKCLALILFSLSEQRVVTRVVCDKYSFDKNENVLFYHSSAQIHRIDLDTYEDYIIHQYKDWQKFMTFVNLHYAVSFAPSQSKLYIIDTRNAEERGEVTVQGNLVRVNDVTLLNISQKVVDFRSFDFDTFSIPEALIQAQYIEIDFYPCDWIIEEKFGCKFRTLYAEKVTTLNVSQGRYRNNFLRTESTKIKSIESDFSQAINDINGTVISNENYFHFFNRSESLVIPRLYPSSTSYHKDKLFLQVGGTVVMKCDDEVRLLTKRGFWDGQLVGKYNTSRLESFLVLKNEDSNVFYNLSGSELGKFKSSFGLPSMRLKVGDITIYPGGVFVETPDSPHFISQKGQFGLMVNETRVTLFEIRYHKVTKTFQILQDIYETQNYANVLLGENGRQVIYRDDKQSKMLDLASGAISVFDNLSYINHINGIRPFFRLIETSQALLINPVDGQPIDFDLVSEYQFVSPDYQLYADKALDKYIEYYDHIQQRLISKEQYQELYEKFSLSTSNDNEREKRIQNRKDFVIKHSAFLIDVLRKKGYKDRSVEEFHRSIVDEKNTFGTSRFIDLFIEKRGVAVIKRISDNVEVARIQLGTPLWFLNYVSFSNDSRYVAIAGRYPNDSSYSGLFLVYDLDQQKKIIDNKSSYAVWTSAFTKDDVVAAYTSSPNSFVGLATDYNPNENNEDDFMRDKGFNVRDLNFLTFSPDGKFFACSHQGYLCYRKPDGTVRSNWGHQPSSLVSIRNTAHPHDELLVLHDLSEEGIADTNIKQSVASVSFSNDNSRIMMVGRNGVVVVRNIHL
jgi:hypothetical protein